MKKIRMFSFILTLFLLLLCCFSFSGGPYNIASGKYVLVPLHASQPVYPFYDDDAKKADVSEMLFISDDGIWTLWITDASADMEPKNKLLIGRYQVIDDKVIFLDDTNCCTFSGKISGDRLVVRPDGLQNNFLFVRANSNR